MHKLYFSICLSFFISCLLLLTSCQPETETLNSETYRAELAHLKQVLWPRAYASHDTILLDQILGDDFQMIDQAGNWYSKRDEIAWITAHKTDHDSFRYEIKRLEILDNGTAIICGTGHITNNGQRSQYQSSNVLERRNHQWKAVLSHVSGYRILEE